MNPAGDDCNYQTFAVQFVQGLKTISCKASGLRTIFELAACQSATLEMIASLLTPWLVDSDSVRSKAIGKGCELLGQMVQLERHTLCLRSDSRVSAIAVAISSRSWYAFSVLEEINASMMKEALCGAASFSPNHHRAPTRLRWLRKRRRSDRSRSQED